MAGSSNRIDSLTRPAHNAWSWFRSRPLALQIGVWAAIAVAVAVIGLTLEQRPSNQNTFSGLPDNGLAQNAAGGQPSVANQGGPGREGADVQLAAGAIPTEVGHVSVKNFRATNASVAYLFNETLGNRGRTGLNANQLLSATCTAGACTIKYVPDGPGAGRIIESQGPIWETLVKDPTWKSATIIATVGGPDVAGRGGGPPASARAHGGGPPGVVLSCTRQAVAQIPVWGIEAAPKIQKLCQFGKVELKGA